MTRVLSTYKGTLKKIEALNRKTEEVLPGIFHRQIMLSRNKTSYLFNSRNVSKPEVLARSRGVNRFKDNLLCSFSHHSVLKEAPMSGEMREWRAWLMSFLSFCTCARGKCYIVEPVPPKIAWTTVP